MQSPSIKKITHTRVNARIETKRKNLKYIYIKGIWYMYMCVGSKSKTPKNSKRQNSKKFKKPKSQKKCFTYPKYKPIGWQIMYVDTAGPRGTGPGTRPANNSKHSFARRAETQPVWGQQMEINKFNGRNANEMQIKINTKSKIDTKRRERPKSKTKKKNKKIPISTYAKQKYCSKWLRYRRP